MQIMDSIRVILGVSACVVVFCLICEAVSETHGDGIRLQHVAPSGHHHHPPPCEVCPRHGLCVPKIQCPAHLRPGGYNPLCHIAGQTGLVGVCCFTGSGHAAESDHRSRTASIISPEDIKKAHNVSRSTLAQMLDHAEELLQAAADTVVNASSPSFGHHLSVLTRDETAERLGRGGLLNLLAAQELKARDAISDDELQLGFAGADGPFCPPQPTCPSPPSRYRSVGGECNNPAAPSWGAVHTGFERLLPPHYGDGLWSLRSSSLGLPLPSARVVSNQLVLDSSHPSPTHNLMFMQFGQFIAHDTSSGVVFTIGNGSAISCCVGDGQDFQPPSLQHWACAPVASAPDDAFYSQFGHRCLNFVRTQLAPASDCTLGYAKQMNGATHYIDLSQLYGNNLKKLTSLRAPGGRLLTFRDYGRDLPPLTQRKDCMTTEEGAACFESGDNHGNQIISLTILHTIWTREHNRIAQALARLNPEWSEDTVFFEARRIAQAEFQNIVYKEWLPLLLGPRLLRAFDLAPAPGYSSSYNPHVNPSLTGEFSAAAMRFGHSVVDSKFLLPNANTGDLYEAISIPEVMFQPSRLRLRPFLDRLISGLTHQPMQNVDPFVTESLTRYLFHGGNPFGLDLASINIQRGRDYGLRSYNDYRRLAGLEPFTDFRIYPNTAARRLAAVYQSPEDVDLWVGGLLEEPLDGGVVGLTFGSIMADQFSRWKKGDRYFYEHGPDVNPGAFTPSQLAEIKKVSLARLLCDNRDGFELLKVSPNAFLRSDLPGNEPVPCDSFVIPSMDLNRFKEI